MARKRIASGPSPSTGRVCVAQDASGAGASGSSSSWDDSAAEGMSLDTCSSTTTSSGFRRRGGAADQSLAEDVVRLEDRVHHRVDEAGPPRVPAASASGA